MTFSVSAFSASYGKGYGYGGYGPKTSPVDFRFNTSLGNTTGTLNWQIAGGQNGPNILSELTYKDVQFKQFQSAASAYFNRGSFTNMELFVDYKTGQASGGSVQDSDYRGDNRTLEYSRSQSSPDGSRMQDITVGLTKHIHLDAYQTLMPTFAYTSKSQKMLMTEGVQVIDTYNPYNLGPFRNTLNSTYETQWQGVYAGLGWGLKTKTHELSLNARYFWLDYQAEADWNLRTDFAHPKSFEQWADGTGYGLDIAYGYHFSKNFSLWLKWFKEDWGTDEGTDVVYMADGTRGKTKLNQVLWEATGFTTGLLLRF